MHVSRSYFVEQPYEKLYRDKQSPSAFIYVRLYAISKIATNLKVAINYSTFVYKHASKLCDSDGILMLKESSPKYVLLSVSYMLHRIIYCLLRLID